MDRKSEYRQKLLDPRWQQMRLRVLERDAWTCQKCRSTESTLHVHHIRYMDGDPWDIGAELLVTLCADCHESEPQSYKWALDSILRLLSTIGVRTSLELAWLDEATGQKLISVCGERSFILEPPTVQEIAEAFAQAVIDMPKQIADGIVTAND